VSKYYDMATYPSVVTNVPLLWGLIILGDVIHMWGQGIWEISVTSPQFCCESKKLFEKKLFFFFLKNTSITLNLKKILFYIGV